MIDWLFRSRQDGRFVIAQFPNLPLGLFVVGVVVRTLLHPGTWWSLLTSLALVWWAGDEIARGVNPWRRFLGAVVLAAVVAQSWRSLSG